MQTSQKSDVMLAFSSDLWHDPRPAAGRSSDCAHEVEEDGMNVGKLHSSQRSFIAAVAAILVVGLAGCGDDDGGASGSASGSAEEVLIGAAWPQSGAFSFQGKASLAGAQAAVGDINAAGGIESLNGAKLKLDSVDVGDTPEKATSAVNRFLTQNDDVAAVVGSWLS
jgi:branched-chain amino acid transport system substrate-binding protein